VATGPTPEGAAQESAAVADAAEKYGRRLYRAARGMGFSLDEAEDLVQDVFLAFVTTFNRFEGRSSVLTWLFGILIRKAHGRRRALEKEERHTPLDDEWARTFDEAGNWIRPPVEPDRALETTELAAAIADCLADLSTQQREVLILRLVEGFSGAEVSKILDLTITHTGVLLHRARLRMRECLGAKGWKTDAS
jgi:RNA polymerase sigma-70 factor (ECF subfamily)